MLFDLAYNFTKEFLLYAADIKNYLERGGTIAWGIVPSSDAVRKETKTGLAEKFISAMKLLTDKGIAKDGISSMITPSCGLGTLDEALAAKIMETTKTLSECLGKKEKGA